MGLNETVKEFSEYCKRLEQSIDLFIDTFDNMEKKYNDVLKKLWSANSDIILLQSNLKELEKLNEKNKIINEVASKILERLNKIEEIIKTLEIEFTDE